MNTAALARSAYSNTRFTIRTDRGTEYDVLARITQNLKTAADRGKSGFPALVAALHENRELWTILAGDVADQGNGLPKTLRAQIFYLAEFTHAHTRKILHGDADIDAIVDINTAVMRGLRGECGALS